MPVAYQTNVDLPSFAGIDQSNDGYNMSMRFARYAYNCDFTGGALAPARSGGSVGGSVPDKISTLACFHRRYIDNEDEKDVLVAIANGCVYTKYMNIAGDWEKRYEGLTNSVCDYITYEVNKDETGVDALAPIDVLLFTNADDGMFILYGDTMRVDTVETPYKFGVIARYYDRIWGSAIKDEPDTLAYSSVYDPLDWSANEEFPEDGGGDIRQPSWDGDSFIALRSLGTYLLAFKRNAIWKIYGTNPSEFNIREQYGAGSLVENTIAATTNYVLMLGWSGLMSYDGGSAEPFQQDNVRDIMSRMNKNARDKCCSAMLGKDFYLAMPIDDSIDNNCLLHYNITNRLWSVITGINAETMTAHNDRLFYTSTEAPGEVFEYGLGDVLPVSWVSGWQDLGIKTSVKSSFTLYFMVESDVAFVPLTFRIRTEKKAKEKFVMAQAGKSKSLNINASGRFFRLEIECQSKELWRLVGGIQMHCELDPDF